MQLGSLNDVLEAQLGDLYDAEKQLLAALPKLAAAAHSDELRKAFESHLQETHGHVERLAVKSCCIVAQVASSENLK